MVNSPKKAIYAQIAQKAGVSIATVSRVLNQPNLVRPETCEKVFSAMQSFGYDTSTLETPTHGSKSKVMVLSVPSLENPFYSEIVQGAKTAAKSHGYKLLVYVDFITKDSFSDCVEMLKKIRAEGIITLNQMPGDLLLRLERTLPVIQCCEYDMEADISFVSVDDISASRMVMNHILASGRRRIAFVNGPINYKYARHRYEGYLSALRDAGIHLNTKWIVQLSDVNYSMAVAAIARLLDVEDRPDALFTASDVFAAAGVRAAANCGLSVPEDLVITGFDNVDISSTTSPTLTTVNQPKFQLGYSAFELLIEKLHNPNVPRRELFLDTELIVRESSQPLVR